MTTAGRSLTDAPLTDAMVSPAVALIWAIRQDDHVGVSAAFLDAMDCAARLDDPVTAPLEVARALAIVLAAFAPDDRSPSEMLAWREHRAAYLELREAGFDQAGAIAMAAEYSSAGGGA